MTITAQQEQEIFNSIENKQTKRVCSENLENIIAKPFNVLDHGFVRVVDYMGDDSSIVQAARVSYGKGTKKASTDEGLIRYLLRHRHTTPFEMCEIKFHIKMPIFIARQWIRHRTANVNEYSARYSVMDNEFYIPSVEQLATQSTKNHQGRGEESLREEEAQRVIEILQNDSEQCYDNYLKLMNKDENNKIIDPNNMGIARELARMNLPINIYTQWYWKIDLHNLMHFLYLRADSHAQYEIREYANAMLNIVKEWCPVTYQAFMDYRKNAIELSSKELNVVKKYIHNKSDAAVDLKSYGLSDREVDTLIKKLDL